MTIYDKSGQRIFFQREGATYGKIYDPESALSAFTSVPDDYPHWRRLDIIPEGQDIVLPIVEKLKKFDISDSKHASAIFSGNIEPVDFTLNMDAQALEFLPMAIGDPAVTSHKQEMVQKITCLAKESITNNDYFLLDIIDGSGDVEHHLFWFDVTTEGSAPTVTGINASNRHEVAIDEDDTAIEVAVRTAAAINGVSGVTSGEPTTATLTVTNDNAGAVQPAHDGEAATDFIFNQITQWGSTDYGVVEATDTGLPSFTFRFEQRNATSSEDIIWDAFGVVVESIKVDVKFGDKIAKASITFKCPYALENAQGRADIEPPRKSIDGFPTMSALKETSGSNYYIIQEGTTDRTPETVDGISLEIRNNVEFKSDIAKRYAILACATRRDITMNIVGATGEKELFTYWQGVYKASDGDWIPTGASYKLNSYFHLVRDATYDYIFMHIYNWLLREHNFHFMAVDEAVKMVDMTFEDGSSDTNGRIIDDLDFVSYIDKTVMVV